MAKDSVRVRFAPAPTGMMHLGNIRIGLLNYLFAKQKQGTFIVRIEDTDLERNFDPEATQIRSDLHWLGLEYDEGPGVSGPYAPYFQSQRTTLYQEQLDRLINNNKVYRCFCTPEELEKKRQRAVAMKVPPRYDRTCLRLTPKQIEESLNHDVPFIWRFNINTDQTITFHDLAKGIATFDLSHFSDFAVTRTNGSFTFLFANGVDDYLMKITHILRGEDHLSNTANQVALFHALGAPIPVYWHLPIICNIEGKKLSKRDFGFSLRDLKDEGYLPEAIVNYLAIIGGSFENEIMDLPTLAQAMHFEHIHQSGCIKYDVDKLKWVNHKWIERYPIQKLIEVAKPFIMKFFAQAATLDNATLEKLLVSIKSELITLHDIEKAALFYFESPSITKEDLAVCITKDALAIIEKIIQQHLNIIDDTDTFLSSLKNDAKKCNIPIKQLFLTLRMLLTGRAEGPSMHDVFTLLGTQEVKKRLMQGL